MNPNQPIIRIETIDGGVYTGPTLEQALESLRISAWGMPECKTRKQYMAAVAERCADWGKQEVRTDTAANFLNDLAVVGLVRIVYGDGAEVAQ